MSTSPEDERLLDSLFAEARKEPLPADLQRVEGRLRPWLGAAATASSSTASSKIVKASLALIGFVLLSQQFRDASPSRRSPVETPPGHADTAAVAATAPAVATPAIATAPPSFATVSVADLPTAAATPAEAAGTRNRDPARPAAAAIVTSAPRAPNPVGPAATGEPAEIAESEASFLHRTRAALASDPERALRMTEEHAPRFPRGVLLQERDVIAIDALVRLGKNDEARTKARAFRARYPRSAHESRIAAILGADD